MHTIIDQVAQKLRALAKYDTQKVIFGADYHQYQLNPVFEEGTLVAIEQRYQFKLPEDYRVFITRLGNGGAGPAYGICPFEESDSFAPHQSSTRHMMGGYFILCEEGHNGQYILILNGEHYGKIFHQDDEENLSLAYPSFSDFYLQWLDENLNKFTIVQQLLGQYEHLNQIRFYAQQQSVHEVDELMISLIDAPKPPELFGNTPYKVFGGEEQETWKYQVFHNWQKQASTLSLSQDA